MIIGNKEYKTRALKEISEIKDEGINLIIYEAMKNLYSYGILDEISDVYFKDNLVSNIRLVTGSSIRVQRWDWNGMDEIEIIKKIIFIDDFSAKIKTEKGEVIFDIREKNNSKIFKWNNKQKDDWIKRNMQNVNLNDFYIEI